MPLFYCCRYFLSAEFFRIYIFRRRVRSVQFCDRFIKRVSRMMYGKSFPFAVFLCAFLITWFRMWVFVRIAVLNSTPFMYDEFAVIAEIYFIWDFSIQCG